MAKNNFNFRIKAGLETKDFKRGVNQLRNLMGNLRASFLSLAGGIGIGLGFEKLISSVRDTVTELSIAKATLKNVSDITKTYQTETGRVSITMDAYAENLEYVRNLSNKYGQDLIALTDSYAKFTAASKSSNLSLDQQQYIFEALTRAAATYHLSADRTKDMMNAVVQMMSKGKIASEELRRQLGNTLPGAYQAMADAAGVSTAKLEEMMKNGELLSAEILPKFAERLNEITSNATFDSLQTSLNQFKNAWTELVERSGAEDVFKNLVETGTNALKHLTGNFKIYSTALKNMLYGTFAYPILKGVQSGIQGFKKYKSQLITDLDSVNNSITKLGKNLENIASPTQNGFSVSDILSPGATLDEDDIIQMNKYNKLLLQRQKIANELGPDYVRLNQVSSSEIKNNIKGFEDLLVKISLSKNALTETTSTWGKLKNKTSGFFAFTLRGLKNIGSFIKGFLGPIGIVMVALEAILAISGAIVGKVKKEREEREKLAAIVGDSDKRIGKSMAPTNEEVKKIEEVKDAFVELFNAGNDANAKYKFKELQELVPSLKNIKYEDLKKKADGINELTSAVTNYIQAITSAAEYNATETEIKNLNTEISDLEKQKQTILDSGKPLSRKVSGTRAGGDYGSDYTVRTDLGKKYDTVNATLDKAIQRRAELQDKLKNLQVVEVEEYNSTPDPEETPIEKTYKKDKKALKELKNQYKEGAITQEEYLDSLNKIAKNSYEEATATGALSIDKITQKLQDGKTLSTLEKWYYELSNRAAVAISVSSLDNITKELEKEMDKVMKDFDKQIEFWDKAQKGEFNPKSVSERNTLLDYKKTGYDVAAEQVDIYNDKISNTEEAIEELKNAIKDAFGDGDNAAASKEIEKLNTELDNLKANAKTWEDIKTFEEMKQDLKDIQNEIKDINLSLGDAGFNLVFGSVSSIDSIVGAFERLQDVAEDFDATGWERFMASWSVFESIVNGVVNTMNTINSIMQLTNSLSDIEAQKRQLNNSLLMQENALKATNVGVTTAAAGASTAAAAATSTETAAAAGNIAVKSGEAIAGATASGAKMPFPLNLIAIAAGVAAVIAALSSIAKFENGGIIGGNSTRGDKNLARVNSGEMILNKAQQGTLWNMLNGKGGVGGNVNFKIRGADLIGVINNENSRRRG